MPDLPEKYYIKEGKRISSARLNKVVDAVPRTVRGTSGQINVARMGDRYEIGLTRPDQPVPESSLLRHFVVIQEEDDYVVCAPYCFDYENVQLYDPTLGDAMSKFYGVNDDYPVLVHVAKPFNLQRTPWDGKSATEGGDSVSYSYTANNTRIITNNDTGKATEQSIPAYKVGEVITAQQCQTGYTVLLQDYSGVSPVSVTVPILWMDMNGGGRSWTTGGSCYGVNNGWCGGPHYFVGPVDANTLVVDGTNGLILTPASAFSAPLVGASAVSGGSFPDGTYYYRVSAVWVDGTETAANSEFSVTTASPHSAVQLAIPIGLYSTGALAYRIYRTTTPGVYPPNSFLTELIINNVGPVGSGFWRDTVAQRYLYKDTGNACNPGQPLDEDESDFGPVISVGAAGNSLGIAQAGVVVAGTQYLPPGYKIFPSIALGERIAGTAQVTIPVPGYANSNNNISFLGGTFDGVTVTATTDHADLFCAAINCVESITLLNSEGDTEPAWVVGNNLSGGHTYLEISNGGVTLKLQDQNTSGGSSRWLDISGGVGVTGFSVNGNGFIGTGVIPLITANLRQITVVGGIVCGDVDASGGATPVNGNFSVGGKTLTFVSGVCVGIV